MSVVKHPVFGFSGINSNDQVAQHSLVSLSEADRVRDEPDQVGFRPGPRDTSSTFVFETNLRGALSNARSTDAIEHAPVGDDAWTGLETNQTLGQLISQTRKHRGLSREQVAAQTHIPAYYVRMIESDSYDAIPDQLYLLPFFRRYADFLGLDATKVVTRFICDFEKAENEVHETPDPSAYAKAFARWREIAAATVLGAILLPCIAWGIGTMRRAYRHAADGPTEVASSPDRRSPSADASANPQPLAAAIPVRVPDAITPSPATLSAANVESNSGSQVTPPRAQTRRSGHSHRLIHHSRRSRQKPRRLT